MALLSQKCKIQAKWNTCQNSMFIGIGRGWENKRLI